MKDNLVWIFIHLPKTGGATFNNAVKEKIDSREFIHLRTTFSNKELKNSFITFICGHGVYYGIHKLIPNKEPRYIIFLRDPAERLVSQYNYDTRNLSLEESPSFNEWYNNQVKNEMVLFFSRKIKGKKNSRISIPRPLSLFIRKIGVMKNRNRILLSKKIIKSLSKVDNEDLEYAKNLLDKCWFVGITSNLDNDLKFLLTSMGLKPFWRNRLVSKKNSRFEKREVIPKKFSLNEDIRKQIYKDNPLDVKLYEYAKQLNKDASILK